MANYRRGNVQYVDTSASFTDIRRVHSIKFIGDLGDAANIVPLTTAGAEDTGKVVWEAGGSQDVQGLPVEILDHDLGMNLMDGIKVNITGGAVVYLYIS